MTEREEFEAWAKTAAWLEDDKGRINLRYLGLHHQYVDASVENAWRAWQAKRAPYVGDEQIESVDEFIPWHLAELMPWGDGQRVVFLPEQDETSGRESSKGSRHARIAT